MRNPVLFSLLVVSSFSSAGAETRGLATRIQVDCRTTTPQLRDLNSFGSFVTGQRFRFTTWSGREGFLYIAALRSQGGVRVLFPTADGEVNHMERDEVVQLPEKGWYRFDGHAGDERVYVLVAKEPVPEFDAAVQQGGEASAEVLRFCLNKYAGQFEELLLVHQPKP